MATQNAELVLTAQKSIDGKQYRLVGLQHVPYTNAAQFLSAVPSTRRHTGQIAFIAGTGDLIEIWQFQGGFTDDKFVKIFPQAAAATITSDNGLTKTSNNIQIGGTLLHDTTINNNGFNLSITGTDDNGIGVLNVTQTGSSSTVAFKATASGTSGSAVVGTSSTWRSGAVFSSGAGSGVIARSNTGYALTAGIYNNTSNNNVKGVLSVERTATTAGANGIGGSIDFFTLTSSGINLSNQIISKWTTATFGTRTSEFSITGVNNATTNILLTISGAGIFTLVQSLSNYANDAAAAAGTPAIPVNGLYRNGSVVQMRVS